MNNTKIREAKPTEAEQISELAMRSKAYWGYSKEFMEACRKELSVDANDINSDKLFYFAAEYESKLIGFYALEKLDETKYELEALFVEPKFIGKGIGKLLMNHAKATALKLGAKELIIQGDPNADKFYRAAGGELIGKRESESIPDRFLPLYKIILNGNS